MPLEHFVCFWVPWFDWLPIRCQFSVAVFFAVCFHTSCIRRRNDTNRKLYIIWPVQHDQGTRTVDVHAYCSIAIFLILSRGNFSLHLRPYYFMTQLLPQHVLSPNIDRLFIWYDDDLNVLLKTSLKCTITRDGRRGKRVKACLCGCPECCKRGWRKFHLGSWEPTPSHQAPKERSCQGIW